MKKLFLILLLFGVGLSAFAQNLLRGTVSDEQGPLAGAAVTVAGTTKGVVTDADGSFAIECEPGTLLEVIYFGYENKTLAAQDGMSIVLQEEAQLMDEAVVTALGIKRER